MSGFRLVRQTLSAARQRFTTRVTARGYHDGSRDFAGYVDPSQFPRIRILRPALVCLGTTAVIYLGCAAYEVRQDAVRASSARSGISDIWPGRGGGSNSNSLTYDELEARKAVTQRRDAFIPGGSGSGSGGGARSPWLAGLHEPVVAAVSLNMASYLASAASPHFARFVSHAPLDGRSYTLLTSTFGHWGPLHLAVNMYALLQFAPLVMQTPAFDHSNAHAVAFYLGAGAVASLGDQIVARLRQQRHASSAVVGPNLPHVSRGASGVVFALVAALAASEPDRRFGLLFVPGVNFTAQQLLAGLTAVELVGLVWGLPFLPGLGHAAHLAGLVTGVAYVHFNGRKRLWQPARRLAFNPMRRLGMV